MTQATRAQFLSRGAQGGIALVAGSSLLAVSAGDAVGATRVAAASGDGADMIVPAPHLPKVLTAKQATAALTPFFA